MQYVLLKHQYPFIRLHGFTSRRVQSEYALPLEPQTVYMMNFYTFGTYVSLVETGAGLLRLVGCDIGAQLYNYRVNCHNTVHIKFRTLLILVCVLFFFLCVCVCVCVYVKSGH